MNIFTDTTIATVRRTRGADGASGTAFQAVEEALAFDTISVRLDSMFLLPVHLFVRA